ncbi:MAG: helix-turn-helix transcriptional regulator [Polyangiales bacterium]
MSRNGQPRYALPASFGAVVVGSFDLKLGQGFPPHSHPEHQLAWSEQGVLAVTLDARTWVLPPTRALWIPGGLVHAVRASSQAMMRSVYFRKRAAPVQWRAPTVVAISPLLRELIRFLAPDDRPLRAQREARRLLGSLLAPLSSGFVDLPLPRDARARRIAVALTERAADSRSLAQLGKQAGASARTLARLWVAETGVSFGQWRGQLRVRCAVAYLAEGRSVSEVAALVGYASVSAFVAAFRRQVGVPPGAYFSQ